MISLRMIVKCFARILKTFDVFIVEAEARVTLGHPPPCSGPEMGQLWFNVLRKDLLVCDGLMWTTLLQSEDHTQDLFSKCILINYCDSISNLFLYIFSFQQISSIKRCQLEDFH